MNYVVSVAVRVVGTRLGGGSGVRVLAESVSWPCVGAQVKDGSHVVIWTAYKITHDQYGTSCGFRSHPWGCIHASGSIISIRIGPDYQYVKNIGTDMTRPRLLF